VRGPVGLESGPRRLERAGQQVLVVGDDAEVVVLEAATLGEQHRLGVQDRGDGEGGFPHCAIALVAITESIMCA
jgi:hypothetical protein